MAVIAATDEDVQILARLIRAEAEGEGKQGMLNAGNVMVNRVRYDCSDFTDVRTIPQMAFQSPGALKPFRKVIFIKERGIKRSNLQDDSSVVS